MSQTTEHKVPETEEHVPTPAAEPAPHPAHAHKKNEEDEFHPHRHGHFAISPPDTAVTHLDPGVVTFS
jgi:hypothetical protein